MRKAKDLPIGIFSKMNKFLTLTLLVVFAASCGEQPANSNPTTQKKPSANADRGNEIVAEFLKRDAAPLRKSRVRFNITSEDGVKLYEIDVLRKQSEGETVTLTQFIKPEEDSDLASLTVEAAGKPTVVTTYSTTLKDFRETDTSKIFFGGITAGELLGEWGKFDFRLIKEDAGQFQLEGKLKKGESGTVARSEVTMRADNYVPTQLKLFDSSDKHIRTFDITETKSDDHGAYASKTIVDNPIYKSKTEIEILSREFPASTDPAFFTRDKLKAIATRAK